MRHSSVFFGNNNKQIKNQHTIKKQKTTLLNLPVLIKHAQMGAGYVRDVLP